MEGGGGGDIFIESRSLSRSLRSGGNSSSSIWRSSGVDAFSKSMRDDEDEENLMWAALERLPTYDRLRKGILTSSSGGGAQEIDIDRLGLPERHDLLDRLVRFVEEDNERFLLKFKDRIDRVGLELPTIEVRFEHLNVEAEATEASRALPTFINFMADMIEGFLKSLHILPSSKKHLNILKDISGIIKPQRLALLLGPPGSGKTTLLLALAGKLDRKLKCSGRITYNGHGMNEFVPQRTAAYISQHDLHIAQMTVRETLAFSARCQGVGSRHHMLAELVRREKASNIKPDPDLDAFMKAIATDGQEANVVTDYILKILGLDVCADTMVGNEMLRGISGGQRKRLTTGEMLVGPAKALFMDEISTGLDSSTTFQIVNSVRQSNHILKGTALISLLQPAPETYELFDDVILVADGQIVYQGPREHVLEFFEHMGFRCPERKGVADFLQEVTSKKDQEQYWAQRDVPYRFIPVKEFAEAFNSFHVGRRLNEELSTPYDKKRSHPAALATEKFGVGRMELFKTCLAREFLLLKRNAVVYVSKAVQIFFMALVASTVFLRTKFHKDSITNGGYYLGALFFSVIMFLFAGMADISLTVAKLPVFYKQRDLLFYPPWAFSLPPWIAKSPITFIEAAIWVFTSYYIIGYDPDVTRLFKQYLLLVLVGQMAAGLFRTVAAAGRNMVVANTFGSYALLLLFALGGFVLSHDDVKKWWIWGYWLSPLMYAQNAISVNEFRSHSWNHYLPNTNETLGVLVLKSRGFVTEPHWYWMGVGALIGFVIVLNGTFTLCLAVLNPFESVRATLSDDSEHNATGDRTRGAIQLSNMDGQANSGSKKGMILPFEPHSITFDDITYSVDMPAEMRSQGVVEDKLVLLREVSGAFRPGVLTALMGVSGAGKTTLMDVLAGRKTGGYIEGNITISGYPKNQETFARISGYCEQNDIHSPNVTVHESLLYSAWLRLPPEIDSNTREMFIEEVMDLVELNPIRNALVGLPGVNGLSTEQRKRLTIAVELVANPSIIFMDEPTSGLDARAAAIVMRTVRNTVDTGRTVVCTIHQPSIDIFESFDELLLLRRGGQEIYAGPLGHHSAQLIKYFEAIPGVNRIREGYNPATWMLEVTTAAQELALGVDFIDNYKNSDLYRRNKSLIKELSAPAPGSKDLYFPTQFSQPSWTQFKACLCKQHWSYWRNPPYTAVRLLFTTIVASTFGTMFWDMGSKTKRQVDLFNAMGSMYAAVFFIGVQNASSVQPVVAIERSVFYRERAAGMYSALPYAFAQVIIELPYALVQAVIYGVLVYSMIGFNWTVAKFFWYLFFMYFTMLYFTFYGMMAVGLTPNYHISAILSSMFYGLWNLFSGFIIPRPYIPVWWRWYSWVCPVAWTLYGLTVSQFGDIDEPMDTGTTVEEYIRHYFGFQHDFLGVVSAVVIGFAVLFAFIYAFCIKQLNFQRR